MNPTPETRARDHEALFGRARDGVAVLSPDWRIRYANASLLEILDLMGGRGGVSTFWDAVPAWEHTPEADELRRAMRSRVPARFRIDRERGGGYVWEVTAEPADGGELHVRLRNVTARAEQEELERRVSEAHASLADRESRLEEIVAGAPVALALLDARTMTVVEANGAYAALLDPPWDRPGAVVGHAMREFIPRYEEAGVAHMLETVRDTGQPYENEELEYPGFSRGTAWFRLSVTPLGRGEEGTPRFLLLLAVEVTALVRARREVEAERRALFDVLDTLPVGVIVAEAPSGRTSYMNPAAVLLGGRPVEALSAPRLGEYTARWQAFRPDGAPFPEAELPLARALRGEPTRDEQLVLRRPDGGERRVLVSGVPLRGPGGAVERGMVAFYDVTDQLLLERTLVERTTEAEHAAVNAALRAEESRALREMGRALVSSLDPEDVLRLAAQNAMELLGSRGSFVSTPEGESGQMRISPALGVMAQVHGTLAPLHGSAAEVVLRDGRTQRFNAVEHFPEGSPMMPVARRLGLRNVMLVPMRAYGEVLGVLGVVDRDGGFGDEDARLLEAFADSAALAVHNARLYAGEHRRAEVNQALLRAAEALTSTLDPEEVMERIVAVARELVGADGAGLTLFVGEAGEEIRMVVASGLLEPLRGMGGRAEGTLTAAAFERGGPTVFSASDEGHASTAWLRRVGVEHYAVFPLWAGDERLGMLGLVRGPERPPFTRAELDTLALLGDQAELAVRNARLYESAEAASRAKSGFLATMSHELRTPLNALEGYSSLLEEEIYGPVTEAQRGALERMRRARQHLVELIDQVLDVARLESGTKRAQPEPVALPALVRDVSEALRGAAEARGLSYAVEVGDEVPTLHTDPGMVRQILANLIGNAVKFTEQGGVTVRLRAEEDAVLLEVADTGRGIAPELHERVFEPFYQVDPSTTRREGGVGLGLALSREFARLLHGDLTLRSTPGEGSTFTLRLPLEPERERP